MNMDAVMSEIATGLDFQLSENQRMIADMIRRFGEAHIRPDVKKYDESQEFPIEIFKALGEMGLLGILVPEAYGGAGFGYFEYVTAIQELAKFCGGIGLSMAAHNSLCTNHILKFGTEEQKQKYNIVSFDIFLARLISVLPFEGKIDLAIIIKSIEGSYLIYA